MAEKYSRFRDPGTGIQVFLTPVAGGSRGGGGWALVPVLVLLGVVRVVVGVVAWGVFLATRWTGVLRVVLACLGFFSLHMETVLPAGAGRNRARPTGNAARALVGRGELVVCNHSSWLDALFLLHAFPGAVFLAPVVEDGEAAVTAETQSGAAGVRRSTPRKNAMSAHTNIVTPTDRSTSTSHTRAIVGFTTLSLTQTLHRAGQLPLTQTQAKQLALDVQPLDTLLASLPSGPAILFPECTTSNNRALLALPPSLPLSTKTPVHVVSVKYTSLITPTTPTPTFSAPTTGVVIHALGLLTTWPLRQVQLRRAHPTTPLASTDDLANALSSLARLKKTSITWQDKADFLTMLAARR